MRYNAFFFLFCFLGITIAITSCTFDTGGLKDINLSTLCGNNIREDNEICDGSDFGDATCENQGYTGGTLRCAADCRSLSFENCTGEPSGCGDGVIAGSEECDDENVQPGDGCAADCRIESGWSCSGEPSVCNPGCGDGVIAGSEECDGTDVDGKTCETLGFPGGDLSCTTDCTIDTNGCWSCGNNRKDPNEQCDGTEYGGSTCVSLGFPGGDLSCTTDCTIDTNGCWSCGNNRKDPNEECDGTDVDGKTCRFFSCRVDGNPNCNATCSAFDLSPCQVGHDEDGDGVDDWCDNCPTFVNSLQTNGDSDDEVGDECEHPDDSTFLAHIAKFEAFYVENTEWNFVNGNWTWQSDYIHGNHTGISYALNSEYNLPTTNYAIDIMYDSVLPNNLGDSRIGAIFGYAGSGNNVRAYICVVQLNIPHQLQIWERVPGNSNWRMLANSNINHGVVISTWQRIRVFTSRGTNNNNRIECEFRNSADSSASVSWTSSIGTPNPFTGLAGLYINNLQANFTSFLVYTP